MRITFLFIVILICTSCADKKEERIEEKATVEISDDFVIEFNFKSDQPDQLRFIVNFIEEGEFQKKHIQILEDIIATNSPDKIVANFGPNNISKTIVVNLGTKEEKTLEILSVKLKFKERELLIDSDNFETFFRTNDFVEFNKPESTLVTKRIDGVLKPVITLKVNAYNFLTK